MAILRRSFPLLSKGGSSRSSWVDLWAIVVTRDRRSSRGLNGELRNSQFLRWQSILIFRGKYFWYRRARQMKNGPCTTLHLQVQRILYNTNLLAGSARSVGCRNSSRNRRALGYLNSAVCKGCHLSFPYRIEDFCSYPTESTSCNGRAQLLSHPSHLHRTTAGIRNWIETYFCSYGIVKIALCVLKWMWLFTHRA